jgi:PAS domain S-box-containing protein
MDQQIDTLHQLTERMSVAQRCAKAGLWDWNIVTNEVYWSPEYYKLYGINLEVTPDYNTWLASVMEADQVRVDRQIQEAIANRQALQVEFRYVHPELGLRWFMTTGDLIYDETGQPIRSTGISLDITDRKLAELALQEREAQLKLASEAGSFGLWYWDIETDTLTWSDQAKVMFGLPVETEMSMQVFVEAIHPDDRASVQSIVVELQANQPHTEIEYRTLWADGTVRWILARGNCAFNAEGTLIATRGVLMDITQRKQAEAELLQKNAILNVINEASPTPIFVKNRQGQIIYANPATLEVLDRPASEVIGAYDSDLYPNLEDALKVMENDQRIMNSGETEVVEETPDGIRTFLGMKAPYRNELGEVVGLIGISNDITDRVQLERDRERILQQEQAAREAAEQANRIKDEFLAVLSHELRTPMNPILGWANLLQQGKLTPERTKEAIATIKRNAQLQVQLIDDLLDISRILSGKLTLNAVPVDLAGVIQSAIETVRLSSEAKAISIHTELLPSFSPVMGDAGRLQQVVWNLLSNAIKFTPEQGEVTVTLTTVGTMARIEVRDTGKGIKPEFLPYVFESFRQEDGAITRRFGGLGLGLAIVRQIVELHGGRITVDSPGEGQGSTFTLQIPLALTATENFIEPPAETASSDLSGVQILVVDDELDSLEFVVFVLEQAGAIVTAASSGATALEKIQQSVPDAIVSDIGMPQMDGYQLIKTIRSLDVEQGGRIPAIALTAYAGEFDQQQALQAGFRQHLSKPVEPEALIQAIGALCNAEGKSLISSKGVGSVLNPADPP